MAFFHEFGKKKLIVYNERGFITKDRGVVVMAQHTKDEINFHGFLTAMKNMQHVSYSTLGKGIYTTNVVGKIVRGELLPRKLSRDRIVARLGVSGEGYEDYLPMEEYADWQLRQDILKCIEEKDVDKLSALLEKLESMKLDKVEKQFLETMRYMMLKMQNATEEKLCKTIETAVSYTIPVIDEGFPKKLLLADQEINLLIEYVSLHRYGASEEDNRSWRFKRYVDIFRYIEQSKIDNIGKAKVYPKLVFYVCQEYQDNFVNIDDVRRCLELCNDAIELLRNTRKLYYFVELLETRQWLIARLLESNVISDETLECELRKASAVSQEWAEVLIDLYIEYDVSPYMEDFGYLYLETESYCINDIVRIRRKMLGLTQLQVAEGACDERTVRRTERHQMDPQMYAVRGMFKNLGLYPEYVRANVITQEPETMEIKRLLSKYSNERNVDKWRATIEQLEACLCMDIVQNKQAVYRERILLQEYTKEISKVETIEKLVELLELTIRVERLLESEEWYLTVEEINILHNILTRCEDNSENVFFKILHNYSIKSIHQNSASIRMGVYDLIITGLANYLGNKGEYELSNWYGSQMIKSGLENRRMRTLARNLYSNCWNKYNIDRGESLARDNQEVVTTINRCILLGEIMKNNSLRDFMIRKLKD